MATTVQATVSSGFARARPSAPSASHDLGRNSGVAWIICRCSRRAGLAQGLPVVLGYLDLACGALGAGAYGAGIEAGVSILGATGMHLRLVPEVDHVVPSAAMTGYCMPFPVPGYTLQMQTNMAASLNLDWLASLVQDAARLSDGDANIETGEILHILDRAVMEAGPGRCCSIRLFLPLASGVPLSIHTPAREFLALTKVCDCHSWRERCGRIRTCRARLLHCNGRSSGKRAHYRWGCTLEIDTRNPSCLLELSRERRDTRRDRGGRGSDDRGCQRRSVSRYGCLRRALDRGDVEGETEHPDYPGRRLRPFVPGLPQGYETLPTVWRQLHAARAKIHGV